MNIYVRQSIDDSRRIFPLMEESRERQGEEMERDEMKRKRAEKDVSMSQRISSSQSQ